MFRKILLFIFLLTLNFSAFSQTNANRDCTVLGPSDYNTFKEYCHKITDTYLSLKNKYDVNNEIDSYLAGRILTYGKQGLNYLPDDLLNKNYYTELQTAIEKGVKDPKNSLNFSGISTAIENFLNKTKIEEISGDIEVFPASGNAPLTVTFRGNVSDPTGSQLQHYNYTWWILDGGKRKNIGSGSSLNYTFREEGNFSVFLDVTSNHRNNLRNTDVIPFSKKVVVSVKEKAASVILKVNSKNLESMDELKFTPEESIYGLIFDATSSTPTSGTKFIQTEWNFGNGIVRKNNGGPKIERVVYATEGEYNVRMKLTTNAGKEVERKFIILVRNPIASIKASSTEGFLGDKFTFSANSYVRNENLSYFWEIVDLKNDKVIFNKNLSNLSYSFPDKGRYNLKLTVTSPSGEKDYDNKIIYINSRPPIASFTSSIPNQSKPNTVFLDASASYDLDFSDDGELEYSWIINGDRVKLDNPNFNGSNGYFTFKNVGEQSVSLEVRDPDDLIGLKTNKININSNLSVDFLVFPRVVQLGGIMKFVADSPRADFFEWDFGDGTVVGGNNETITHKYTKAGIYKVRLTVRNDGDGRNSVEKTIYVSDADSPYAQIKIFGNSIGGGDYGYKDGICDGKGAYIVNKVDNVNFSGADSIDITGLTSGLDYSWKIGDKFFSTQDISRRFEDIGCIPVKLTVKSQKNGKESVAETYLKVENLKPTLTGLDIQVKDISSDPVVVDVKALGAQDRDGVIQSYLWYYYTDVSSEPQDFRATKTPSTTFVLPKITGTYYFVAVLKDNNEDRVSSDELGPDTKYFVTLTGDNLNTPIIGLSANNTSVKSGEEVVFTANVTNILGQNLNNDVKYSWDFDGDGFYDKETIKNVISHKFTKSGEYRIKVKVKNKGFSNTKTITVNVSNILKPDFDYISIGNDFIFFDKSEGNIDSYSWEMGDGQTLDKKGSFMYSYSDGKASRLVKLTISEGSNKRETSKKIVRDFGKMISTKREPLSIFSNYAINNDKIVFNEEVSDLQIFLKSNLPSVSNYAVDFNIENDSDLNGGKDDDEDNKNTLSYTTGGPISIELNDSKIQKVKIFLKDKDGKILETKNLTIEKNYIKEKEVVSAENIKLEGVPDSIKKAFDEVKLEINKLDPENKLKSLVYLQKLQEEWSDARERTNIIIEFSRFIGSFNPPNSEEIKSLLEGMLVDEEGKKDEMDIIFNALKNVIPKDITCSEELQKEADSKKTTCYNILISRLETIHLNDNVQENKELGKEILNTISTDKVMTNEQKVEFKAFLQKLVNRGEDKLSEEEKKEIGVNAKTLNSPSESGIFGKIGTFILWAFIIIFGIFIIGGVIYFISYKLKGDKEEQSFTDYVAEKTNNTPKFDVLADEKEEKFDPLADDISNIKKEEKNTGNVPDWLKGAETVSSNGNSSENFEKEEKKQEEFKEEPKTEENGEIPDWLKVEEEPKIENSIKEEEFKEEPKTEESGEIPDWLKVEEEPKIENLIKEEEFKEEPKTEETGEIPDWLKVEEEPQIENLIKEEEFKEEIKAEEIGEVPDWLKNGDVMIKKSGEEELPKLETKEELDEFTKIDLDDSENSQNDELPDWLKGTFADEVKKVDKKEEQKTKKSSDDFSSFDSLGLEENLEEKTKEEEKKKKTRTRKTKKADESKEEKKSGKDENKTNDEELWDDGMKIPDWLKTDSDK